ncbi:hypothetical protein GWK47_035266 [Chionoecetes opilio]|uniref:Uncharacterized protein n=1 Tax=Chionoecetes opilio TaxID=41210 RepID=A0A8J4YNC3_CHIOP|nr:hypothetical protein GWK47_035266 [Chionoecetes opilio]
MEGCEDEPSDDSGGPDTALARHHEESEEEFVAGRRFAASSQRNAMCSWSSRSGETEFDGEETSFDSHTVASQGSLASSRCLRREKTMSSYRAPRGYQGHREEECEVDGSSEGEESHRWRGVSSEEGGTEDEAADQTVIETSCDEASFNTSICSYKDTGSSSELSVDPVVWKKFKFLSSILKETQHNLRAMDDLILEQRRVQGQPTALPQPPHSLHQGLGDGEPKTDEAKLEEILSLLHHLTHTLSSYEQHPLLASAPHLQVGGSSLHPEAAVNQQALASLWTNGNIRNTTIALHDPSPHDTTAPIPRHPYPHVPPLHPPTYPPSPDRSAKICESPEGKNVTFTTSLSHSTRSCIKEGGTCSNGFTQTLHTGPDATPSDARLLQDSPGNVYSRTSPHYPPERSVDHVSSSMPSEVTRGHKKDTINQTDPFLLMPRVREEHASPHNAFSCQSVQPESLQGQEVLHHPLMKETRSLRKEIDDIMTRKLALDSRLQSLIAHRAMQRELDEAHMDAEPRRRLILTKSKSLEDGELRRSKSKHRKYKARSKSCEEESHAKRKTGPKETYLSMIDENQDEFPSLSMESLNNEVHITALLTDEADIPGLGDSGLSSEINSINATIQELVRENQQLHKFLQGMTSESILKVDQEKLALEARLQSLDKENQSLLTTLDEDQDSGRGRTKASKGVKFCVHEESEEEEASNKETKDTRRSRSKETDDLDEAYEVQTDSSKTEDAVHKNIETNDTPLSSVSEPVEKTSPLSSRADTTSLTRQNQELVNRNEAERYPGKEDSQKTRKTQSIDEEISVTSVGESVTDTTTSMKEVEKLKQKIKKLTNEREVLEFKLSKEASERDYESTRLEARIQILNGHNQTLTQKLQNSDQTNTRKAETSCQTDTPDSKYMTVNDGEREREPDHSIMSHSKTNTASGKGKTITAPQHASPNKQQITASKPSTTQNNNIPLSSITVKRAEECKQVSTTANKPSATPNNNIPLSSITVKRSEEYDKITGRSMYPTAMEECLTRHHIKDLPLSMLGSDENISTDDDKISQIRTPREDLQPSQQSEGPVGAGELYAASGDVRPTHEASGRRGSGTSGTVSIEEDVSIHNKHAHIQQLEALVTQNKVIANNLSELKLLSKASESNRESAFIKIMEENVRVMQSIGGKLASAALPALPPAAAEPDARVTRLSTENQDLKTTLQHQQKRIEVLINQNSSLEKKLHVAQRRSKEGDEDTENLSGSDVSQIPEDETLSTRESKAKNSKRVPREVSSDASIDRLCNGQTSKKVPWEALSDISMDRLSNGKQREAMETSRVSVSERRQSSKPLGHPSPPVPADLSRETVSPDPAGIKSHQQDGSLLNGSSESSRRGSPDVKSDAARERRKRGSGVLDPDTQRLLDAALRKEKDNRTHLLQEAEREKEALQDRLVTLVRENDCLAARLEEVVSVSRNLSGHMHSVKDQLLKVEAEKDHLHKKVKSLEDGCEDSSLSLPDSIGSSHLTQRLKERVHSLQDEVERGWQEAHQRTVERDKAVAERESLEYTSSIAINTARREAESVRGQLTTLQEETNRRSLEHTNLHNEFERKCVMAKAAQESQANHLERLVEAESRMETLQNHLKKVEDQLIKEKQARNSVEAEAEEVRARRGVAAPGDGGGQRAAREGEQHWVNTVAHLKSQLHQEQLRARLLEAGEQESSGRVLTLQRSVREAREAQRQLQDKYNQLRAAYRHKKAEKTNQRELSQLYTSQVKELGKTSADLEDNFKAMLCALGESVEVSVELLASHVFLTPCLIHPGPALHQDPEAWFGAQQGRLRWLQSQLRKLCLHNWKTGNLPKTTNLVSTQLDLASKDNQVGVRKSHMREEVGVRQVGQSCTIKPSGAKVDSLCELSILEESRSYATTPARRRSSASDITFTQASSPFRLGGEIKHSTPKHTPIRDARVAMTPPRAAIVSGADLSPGVHQGSVYLNEAERILSSQQKKLAESRYSQYKTLINSLQQDVEKSLAPSPSIPSSMFTTPERIAVKPSQDLMTESNDSLDSEASHTEVHYSFASSPSSASPAPTESSSATLSHSGNSVKDKPLPGKEMQDSREEESKSDNASSTKSDDSDSQKLPKERQNGIDTKLSPKSSSHSCVSVESATKEGRGVVGKGDARSLKEEQESGGRDVDKDRDSWEAEEDLFRVWVDSEGAGPEG